MAESAAYQSELAHSDYQAEASVYGGRVLIRLHRTSLGRTEQAMYLHAEDLDAVLAALDEPGLRSEAARLQRRIDRRTNV